MSDLSKSGFLEISLLRWEEIYSRSEGECYPPPRILFFYHLCSSGFTVKLLLIERETTNYLRIYTHPRNFFVRIILYCHSLLHSQCVLRRGHISEWHLCFVEFLCNRKMGYKVFFHLCLLDTTCQTETDCWKNMPSGKKPHGQVQRL